MRGGVKRVLRFEAQRGPPGGARTRARFDRSARSRRSAHRSWLAPHRPPGSRGRPDRGTPVRGRLCVGIDHADAATTGSGSWPRFESRRSWPPSALPPPVVVRTPSSPSATRSTRIARLSAIVSESDAGLPQERATTSHPSQSSTSHDDCGGGVVLQSIQRRPWVTTDERHLHRRVHDRSRRTMTNGGGSLDDEPT